MKGDREVICDDGNGPGQQKRNRITKGIAAKWQGTSIVDSDGNVLTARVFQIMRSMHYNLYSINRTLSPSDDVIGLITLI